MTKTNRLKKFRTLKLISGAGFLFFLCLLLQEFLFQLPSCCTIWPLAVSYMESINGKKHLSKSSWQN